MISNDVKFFDYSSINAFLAQNSIWIKNNPCVSPDFCLDWNRFTEGLKGTAGLTEYSRSTFSSDHGEWTLVEDQWGDHAWRLRLSAEINEDLRPLSNGFELGRIYLFSGFLRKLGSNEELDPGK